MDKMFSVNISDRFNNESKISYADFTIIDSNKEICINRLWHWMYPRIVETLQNSWINDRKIESWDLDRIKSLIDFKIIDNTIIFYLNDNPYPAYLKVPMIAISKDGAPWSELVQFTILWDGRFELYRFSDVTQYIEPIPEKVIEIDTRYDLIFEDGVNIVENVFNPCVRDYIMGIIKNKYDPMIEDYFNSYSTSFKIYDSNFFMYPKDNRGNAGCRYSLYNEQLPHILTFDYKYNISKFTDQTHIREARLIGTITATLAKLNKYYGGSINDWIPHETDGGYDHYNYFLEKDSLKV